MMPLNRFVCRAIIWVAILSLLGSCRNADIATPTTSRTPPTASASVTPGETQVTTPTVQTPNVKTATPSNASVLATMLQTPQPTPMPIVPPNETGITPGVSTEEQVRELLGEPYGKYPFRGMAYWIWRKTTIPNLSTIYFSNGVAREISLDAPGATPETIVARYGAPEVVIFYPQSLVTTSAPGITAAPIPPASGVLLYPSRGIQVEFACEQNFPACPSIQSCIAVPRKAYIPEITYVVPTTISEWIKQLERNDNSYCVRPWSGFSD